MPKWSKISREPSLYAWVEKARLLAAIPAILKHLQEGGEAQLEKGLGGVGATGIALPGEKVAFAFPDLTEEKLKQFLKRQCSDTCQGHVLLEFEWHHLQMFPSAFKREFVTREEIRDNPLTDSADRIPSELDPELENMGEPATEDVISKRAVRRPTRNEQ